MMLYSTSDKEMRVGLREAVLNGLAADGGLFMPVEIPTLSASFLKGLPELSFREIAEAIATLWMADDIPQKDLKEIIERSMTFDAPLVQLSEGLYVLELFHGPTLSFKDFGARFMACVMAYFNRGEDTELNILTATSGDTGSAVAEGFLKVPGINVWILYPSGQVSKIQEMQLATIGANITAIEVEGSFDDCQRLVKKAFNDAGLKKHLRLTSANSINIARLIPQSFYYFRAVSQLRKSEDPIVFSVPSGNFGNLTAGLFAKKLGLPIHRFVAATNRNAIVPDYLRTGIFEPRSSVSTISNAMDVGNPSNFARIFDLFDGDLDQIRRELYGVSCSDEETKEGLRSLYRSFGYIGDPHGAVAYLGLREYAKEEGKITGVFLETAHPAKFIESVEPVIGEKIIIPESIQRSLSRDKLSVSLENNYENLKSLLLSQK